MQRGRIGGEDALIRIFQWQRMTDKTYPKFERRMGEGMQFMKTEVYQALNDAANWARDNCIDIQQDLASALQELHAELEAETPFDPDGPNDPPLHAAEDWKIKLKDRGSAAYTISITNRKHYIQFLEMHGGREDHPGANEGGWISDAFNNFVLNIGSING